LDKAKVLATAQKHLGRNNIDKALKELSRIVREDPKDLRVRQKVAELLARQGKIAEAMREFQVVAEAYERGGFYPKAAAIYKQMLRFEPDQMRWHLALGEIYQQLALLSDAMDHFNIVAQHFEEHGSVRERVEIYEKLLRLNPDSLEYADKLSSLYMREADHMGAFEVWRSLSESLEARGDNEGLTKAYEHMSELKPDDLGLVRGLADLYLDRGDARRALAKLQICFKADPQDTETLNLLADAFVDLGQGDRAVAVLKELAQIYDTLGYEDYRNQVYDRIAEIDPTSSSDLDEDASLELPGGEEVISGLELSEPREAPEDVARAVAEAEVYLQYGLADKAADGLEKAAAQYPGSWDVHRTLVRLRVGSGDVTGAAEQLSVMYELAMDLHDYRAARACLQRTVELAPDDGAAQARLDAFVQAMGEYSEDDGGGSTDDADVMAAAVELGSSLAGSVADKPNPTGQMDLELSDEFDFDDDEMQRLAAELSQELTDGSRPPTEIDLSMDQTLLDRDEEQVLEDEPTQADTPAVTGPEPTPPPMSDSDDLLGDLLADLDLDLDDDSLLEDAPSPVDIGKSYYSSGKYEDAAVEFQRAIDSGERVKEALEHLGNSLRRMHDFRGAVDAYKRLLAAGPGAQEEVLRIMFELGVTYEVAGNRNGAYKIFGKIVERDSAFRDGEVADRVAALANDLGLH